MDYASANGLIVFTYDLDFGALLASRKYSPSVAQVRTQDVLPADIGGVVVLPLTLVIRNSTRERSSPWTQTGTGSGFFHFSPATDCPAKFDPTL